MAGDGPIEEGRDRHLAYRIVLQIAVFLLPFILYGIYRLWMRLARRQGRQTWPISVLFGIGAVLAIGLWTYLAMREEKVREVCYEPARLVDGVLVPSRKVRCDRDMTTVGAPASDRPGGQARGVSDPPRPLAGQRETQERSADAPVADAERQSDTSQAPRDETGDDGG
jgi:hypothetical protein